MAVAAAVGAPQFLHMGSRVARPLPIAAVAEVAVAAAAVDTAAAAAANTAAAVAAAVVDTGAAQTEAPEAPCRQRQRGLV